MKKPVRKVRKCRCGRMFEAFEPNRKTCSDRCARDAEVARKQKWYAKKVIRKEMKKCAE